MSTLSIRPATSHDYESWRCLWDGYLSFYKVELAQDVTAKTWERILDPNSPVHCLLAFDEKSTVIGFAHYVIHENTWDIKPVCYLEDLFVHPNSRGEGIGEALITALLQLAKESWSQVYWHTTEDNHPARALYDKFTKRDSFVRYVLKTGA